MINYLIMIQHNYRKLIMTNYNKILYSIRALFHSSCCDDEDGFRSRLMESPIAKPKASQERRTQYRPFPRRYESRVVSWKCYCFFRFEDDVERFVRVETSFVSLRLNGEVCFVRIEITLFRQRLFLDENENMQLKKQVR